jgi:hypothetical protein
MEYVLKERTSILERDGTIGNAGFVIYKIVPRLTAIEVPLVDRIFFCHDIAAMWCAKTISHGASVQRPMAFV